MRTKPDIFPEKWLDSQQRPVACEEKLKLLNENLMEIYALCQDALEDAVLMGCDEAYVRSVFHNMVEQLSKPFSA